jgi:hypothetical protein
LQIEFFKDFFLSCGEIKIEIDGSPAPDKIKTQSKRLTYDSE